MGKKRTIKRFQRTFAVLGLLVVFSSIFVSPAFASELTGDTGIAEIRNYGYPYESSAANRVEVKNVALPLVNQAITSIGFGRNDLKGAPQVRVGEDMYFGSVTDIYFSFYPYITDHDISIYYYGNPYDASNWYGNYRNSQGAWGYLNSVDLTSFTPVSSNNWHRGVSLRASYAGSEGLPISNLCLGTATIQGDTFVPSLNAWGVRNSDPATEVYYYVTSLRVITTESTADSEAIADVANQIGSMSDLLSAKLGDIAQIVQLIYEKTGDIDETLNMCLGYFEVVADILDRIDSTTSDIYSLLDTQLQALISTINTASTNIQSSIAEQTRILKSEILEQTFELQYFFNQMFGSSTSEELAGETEDIQSGMDNVDNAEQGYISTATDRFDGIVGDFTGFNSSVSSGVSLVSTLFERVWNSFGDYVIVYSFPLSLGLVLLLIGRISRASARTSRGSSKGKGGDNT